MVQSINHIDNTAIQGVFAVTNVFSISANILKKANPVICNKFILDSGATVHVCNDHSRFIDMQEDKQWLTHGDTRTWISSHGTVRLWMITPDSQDWCSILLSDIIYCSEFQLNIVSFPCFYDKKLFWDTEFRLLYHQGRNIACVWRQGNLFLVDEAKPVEFNNSVIQVSSESVNTNIKHSSKPLISKVPADIWHHHLGHIYHRTLAWLPQLVDSMAIKNKHEDNTCLTCTLAKATNQVSWCPAQCTRWPGEHVHLDLIDNIITYNSN